MTEIQNDYWPLPLNDIQLNGHESSLASDVSIRLRIQKEEISRFLG